MDEPEKQIDPDQELELLPDEEGIAPDLQKKTKKLKDDLKKCEEDKKTYLDGWQRAKADYINYKNDEGKRFEDMARFITSGFITDILPVLDSFELALRSFQLPASSFQQNEERGILVIRSQLLDVLKKRGLEEIKIKVGETFNPEMHESIGEIESSHPEGSVAEVVQRGYDLRGKVIRPVRVRLSKSQHLEPNLLSKNPLESG